MPLHPAGLGRIGPATTCRRAAHGIPGARQAGAGWRRHGRGGQRHALVVDREIVVAVDQADAALTPDTADKFIYFLAIPEGGGAHVFAKSKEEHDANRAEYGYD